LKEYREKVLTSRSDQSTILKGRVIIPCVLKIKEKIDRSVPDS